MRRDKVSLVKMAKGSIAGVLDLHSEGDVILVVSNPSDEEDTERFLVSSTLLSVASPYFKVMFGPSFKEGAQVREGTCPEIILHDDHPSAMRIILCLLHYKFHDNYRKLDLETLAIVAQLSDKYQCNEPLSAYVQIWLEGSPPSTAEQWGLCLVAAFFFNEPEAFQSKSKEAIQNLEKGFESSWASHEVIKSLPQEFIDWLKTSIHDWIDPIQNALRKGADDLRNGSYGMAGLICLKCGKNNFKGSKKCTSCRDSFSLEPWYCTDDIRVGKYFRLLSEAGLWPTNSASSLKETYHKLLSISEDNHECPKRQECVMVTTIDTLANEEVLFNECGIKICKLSDFRTPKRRRTKI